MVAVVVAVVAANVQAFRVRHITTEFSESRYIALSMLIILQTNIISLPIFFYETDGTEKYTGVAALIMIVTSGAILYLIFVPRLLRKLETIHTTQR